ncbi:MAG: response regulator transcription factor [Bacteriovoracaceae bacterium]
MKNIWVIEDEVEINSIYQEVLSHSYKLQTFLTIGQFTEALKTSPAPDLIISDIRLPDGNFLNYLKDEGKNLKNIPYLVVSAVIDVDALRYCFEEGAVDYLTKPFHVNELQVKIERFFNLRDQKIADQKKQNPLTESFINTKLTYKESKIIALLMKEMNSYVARKDIIETVWNSVNVHPKTLDVHLYNLRRKIDPLGFQIFSDSTGRLKLTQVDDQ